MSESIRSRRLVALFAAYVVALQAVLLPLSIAASAPFGSSLCASAVSTGGQTGNDQYGCPCAAGCGTLCCVQGTLGSPPQIVIAFATVHTVALPPARYSAPVQKPASEGPQLPRPPPAA